MMNAKNGHDNTPACLHANDAALSEFVENTLPPARHAVIAAHLQTCPRCAQQVRELQSLVRFFHETLPAREPVLEIWNELAPKVQAWEAEERLGAAAKMRLRSHRFLHNVAAGAILFTQVLAMNTETRMHKYLLGDSLRFAGGTNGGGMRRGEEAR